MTRPAAFMDRDGTIIRDANYVRDPKDVVLLPGAAEAVRLLNERGVATFIITNQSGIARGYLNTDDYERVRARVVELLAAQGARIDDTYMCPHLPEITGECDCRKPGLGMYRKAIADHGVDGAQSLFVGDRWRDVAPASAFGGLPILLDVDSTPPADLEKTREAGISTARSLAEAVQRYVDALPPRDGEQ